MINLYVYQRDVGLIGEISDYESLEIEREYYKVSKLVLRLPKTKNNANLLKKGNLLAPTSNINYAYIIQHFSAITEGGLELLEIYAYSLNYILSYRTLPNQFVLDGNVEYVIKQMIRLNAINTDSKRIIPGLFLGPDSGISDYARVTRTGGNLLEHSFNVLESVESSIDILFNPYNSTSEVLTWRGVDRSIQQNVNPHVMFSTEFDNVLSQNFFSSDLDLKNVAYVAGEGEGANRIIEEVNDYSGWDRRELYIDARDLQSTYKDEEGENQSIPPSVYAESLISRGLQKLSENKSIETFESTVDDVQYIIGRDYYLGDKVTFYDRDLNVTINARVTSIKTTSNQNGVVNVPSFGSAKPNKLINKEV